MGLSAVVAVVTGVVLAFAGGADRTASAPDRYEASWGAGFDARVEQERGVPRTADVARLPGVEAVRAATFVFGGLMTPDGEFGPEALVFAGSPEGVGTRVVAGRAADPAAPGEFVASKSFVDEYGIDLGDRFKLVTLSVEQADRAGFDALTTEEPRGPSTDAVMVGVADGPSLVSEPDPIVFFGRSLAEEAGVSATIMAVRLRPGTGLEDLRHQLDTLPDGDRLGVSPAELIEGDTRTAVNGQAIGLWLLTAVAAAAALVTLGQLLTRTVRLSSDEETRLAALGFNRAQLVAEPVGRAAIPVMGGTLAGTVIAAFSSAAFPMGFVRRLEPDPGLRADVGVLLVGATAAVAALLLWTVIALAGSRRASGAERPSTLVERWATRCPSSAQATGVRFAFTRSGRDQGSVRAAVTGMLMAIALLVATVVVGSSLNRLISDGSRHGNNFDVLSGTGGEAVPDDVRSQLAEDENVTGLILYGTGSANVGSATLGLAGMEPVKGDLRPVVLTGRLPVAEDEIALGREAADDLDTRVGRDLTLAGSDGEVRFRVTGLAVVPAVEGLDGVGEDAVVTMDGLRRVDAEARPSAAAAAVRPGRTSAAIEQLGLGQQSKPYVIGNLARVRAVPFLLAAMLGTLAVLTLVHVMVTSVRHRRRDIAALRCLGADRRWITRAVHWQANAFWAVPLALGAPLGLLAGRRVFGAMADSVGAVPDASFPYAVLAASTAAFVALANAAAAGAAHRARRLAPAPILAAE